jgi:acyl carrier protein
MRPAAVRSTRRTKLFNEFRATTAFLGEHVKSKLFNRIATELCDSDKLSRAIEAQKPVQHRKRDGYVAPQTELQQSLASLWAEFLKADFVGLDDNFFEMGGHSLLAMEIAFQIRETFSVEFPLEAFLMTPVLRAQSARIEEMLFKQANEGELEQLLGEIENEDFGANGNYSSGEIYLGNGE